MTLENQNDSWTEPEHLPKLDHKDLKYINQLYKEGKYKDALHHATFNCNTVIREEIPPNIWREIGGELTRMGELKLQAMNKNKEIAGREM